MSVLRAAMVRAGVAAVVACAAAIGGCQSRQQAASNVPIDRTPTVPKTAFDGAEPLWRVVLENGLVIEELRAGMGELCLPDAMVLVYYRGTLSDGTPVDVTDSGGDPRVFALRKLIPGWRDGLAGMRVGGVRRLSIPAALAYGQDGLPALNIPPGADLIYEIELVGVR